MHNQGPLSSSATGVPDGSPSCTIGDPVASSHASSVDHLSMVSSSQWSTDMDAARHRSLSALLDRSVPWRTSTSMTGVSPWSFQSETDAGKADHGDDTGPRLAGTLPDGLRDMGHSHGTHPMKELSHGALGNIAPPVMYKHATCMAIGLNLLTGAYAQEVSPVDSCAMDTAMSVLPTMKSGLVQRAQDLKDAIMSPESEQPHEKGTKPAQSDRNRLLHGGRVEVGGVHGAIPFSIPESGVWNAYARGQLGSTLLGLPVSVLFDLGTDLPVRGQRNSIKLAFDPIKAVDTEDWSDAGRLHELGGRLDSLRNTNSALRRKLAGQQARLTALEEKARAIAPAQPSVKLPDMAEGRPVIPSPAVKVPALDVPPTDVPPIPGREGLADSIPFGTPGMSGDQIRMKAEKRVDSLRHAISETRGMLQRSDEAVGKARAEWDRAKSTAKAARSGVPLPGRLARGIRRFDIGSVTPEGGEFLISGITMQGLSFAYAHQDLFVAVDHGRSFDDTWMNTDPSAGPVRRLQQSLFFQDARDLNPRRLSSLRTGFGPAEGTHVHFGYLRGLREDAPSGMPVGTSDWRAKNHVVQVDMGHVFKKKHEVRIVHARSIVVTTAQPDETMSGQRGPVDLFGASGAGAWKVSWTSDFKQSGTRLGVEGRSVSSAFQSYGVGFIRPGSKALEARWDQTLGERLRLRVRTGTEERNAPGMEDGPLLTLQRGHVQAMWRATRKLTVNGGYSPIVIRSHQDGSRSISQCFTAAVGTRERWRRTVARLNITSSAYTWTSAASGHGWVVDHRVDGSLLLAERWDLGVIGGALVAMGVDSVPTMGNLGFRFGFKARKGASADGSIQLTSGGDVGWSMGMGRRIGHGMTLGLRGQRYAALPVLFDQSIGQTPPMDQAWTLSLAYQW